MSATCIAVMAGTPVDTRMGMEFLQRRDPSLTLLSYPTAKDPWEQYEFQLGPLEERTAAVRALVRDMKAKGARALLVYCNSLSGSLDFEALCAEEEFPVVTPLMVYRRLAAEHDKIGLIAANNQSLVGIERTMLEVNPRCDVLGVSLLPVVRAIEAKTPPEEIVERFGLGHIARFFEQNGVDCMVLGCTHFPYLFGALKARAALPIFNPDDGMYDLLTSR